MDKRIQILDCTLRDGGRCFDNTWGDETIYGISKGLNQAGIDIIEIGFLWYLSNGICRENSTMFRGINEMKPFLMTNQRYVAYIEYVLFKKENHVIPVNDGTIEGIRLGIKDDEIDESLTLMKEIADKGYKLFVQGINIMSYSEEELIEFINKINTIKPYAFAIVDTFGSMYIDDLKRIFMLVDKHLDKDIAVAFHSHNNMQLSFALAITLIEISGNRRIIIDGTLSGIGMGVGNLQTEMICKYLNEKENTEYKIEPLVNLLDKYIYRMKEKFNWETSLLSYESAIKWTSQINLSYIKNEYSNSNLLEQSKVLGNLPVGKGVSKHKIDEIYRIVCADMGRNKEDKSNLLKLKKQLNNREVLIVAKGGSIISEKEEIQSYIVENNPVIVYINHIDAVYEAAQEDTYYWYMDIERCKKHIEKYDFKNVIAFKGVSKEAEYLLSYDDVTWDGAYSGDSVIIMLLLLSGIKHNEKVLLAGMDGDIASDIQITITNRLLKELNKSLNISFLTGSVYKHF